MRSPATMTGNNAESSTAVSVVHHMKIAWYAAVDVIEGDRSIRSLGGTLVKVPPNAEGAKHIEVRAHLYIEQAAMTGVNVASNTTVSIIDNIERVWYSAADVIAGDNKY